MWSTTHGTGVNSRMITVPSLASSITVGKVRILMLLISSKVQENWQHRISVSRNKLQESLGEKVSI